VKTAGTNCINMQRRKDVLSKLFDRLPKINSNGDNNLDDIYREIGYQLAIASKSAEEFRKIFDRKIIMASYYHPAKEKVFVGARQAVKSGLADNLTIKDINTIRESYDTQKIKRKIFENRKI